MKNKFKNLQNIIAISVLLLNSCKIFASSTDSFSVTATVIPACTVRALPLAFGNYDGSVKDGTTTLTVICTIGTKYRILLDPGAATGATTTSRKMQNGSNTLNYALYSNSARTSNWGNTNGPLPDNTGGDTVVGQSLGVNQSYTVYRRIPAGQTTVPAGINNDTINVSITIP